MYSLNNAEYYQKVEPIFKKVFIKSDDCGQPFSCNISRRVIIYPIFVHPKSIFLEAIIQAGSIERDVGCYLTVFWKSFEQPNHCYIPFSQLLSFAEDSEERIEKQLNMFIFPTYVLFSEQGKWGLIVSDTHHGILGGSSGFIELFSKLIPDLDNQVYDFLEDMQDLRTDGSYKKLNWLSGMLIHVYGEKKAHQILEEIEQKIHNPK